MDDRYMSQARFDEISHNDSLVALKQVQKLELENQIMREKIAPLIYENEELRRQLGEKRRIRSQVKTLLSTLDSTIVMHISRLNSREPTPARAATIKTTGELSAKDILAEIKKRDVGSFYALKTGIAVKDKRLFTVTIGTYLSIRRGIKFMVMGIWTLLKAIRKAVR